MSEEIKIPRLGKAAREFNVATSTIVDFLSKKGFTIEDSINTKLTVDMYSLLTIEYQSEKSIKEEAQRIDIGSGKSALSSEVSPEKEIIIPEKETKSADKDKISLEEQEQKKQEKEKPSTPDTIQEEISMVPKLKVLGKIDLNSIKTRNKSKKKLTEEIEQDQEQKQEKKIEIEKDTIIPEQEIETVKQETIEQETITEETNKPEKQEEPAPVEPEKQEENKPAELTIQTEKIEQIEPEEQTKPEEQTEEQTEQVTQTEQVEKIETTYIEPIEPASETIEKSEIEQEQEEQQEPEESLNIESEETTTPTITEPIAVSEEKERQDEQQEDLPLETKKESEMFRPTVLNLKTPTVVGKVDLNSINTRTKPKKRTKEELQKEKEANERFYVEKILHKTFKEKDKVKVKDKTKTKDKAKEKDTVKNKGNQQQTKEYKPKKGEKRNTKPNNFIETTVDKLAGVKVVDKINISTLRKEEKPTPEKEEKKEKRKRIKTFVSDKSNDKNRNNDRNFPSHHNKRKDLRKERKVEITDEEVDIQIKKTLARMAPTGKTKAAKHRREKREHIHHEIEQKQERQAQEKNVLKVTEFITVNDLANMMNVPVGKIIGACMSIGLVVAINQRLDAENIALLAEEYGYTVQFVGIEEEEEKQKDTSNPEDLKPRAPIVTVMGHVDHGKTSLLDYIRNTNVIAGEAGGITQHIGAYEVVLPDERKITFLDTPGHEAFTAMRARGAKVTDLVIVVIAADDTIMPQTIEAINHAQAANVPMIFAINKIDKPGADPEKIRGALANMNLLVEEWGGKIQSQNISAKKGINVEVLLEKILIEAEMLDLKANPTLHATGTVIESSLDKGRGYVAKMLIQNGTLRKGDIVVAGTSYGKIKAMYNERNQLIQEAYPSSPVLLLGLDSAPQAGDTFKVYLDEREAKSIVTKRQQLIREQGLRTQKHITLAEIGRRIAVGDFKELNIIVKGDVDGSIEALSDTLLRLSTEGVEVKIIHKSVGQVTESDVLLASASNAIIIAFQVRPSGSARKLAEQEQIDIRTYSVIYDAINEIKDAIEGMKAPEIRENIVCNVEVRETFRISKVGTVAGCYILDGKIQRNTRIRVIRDGIVIFTGKLGSLKRFKEDVREVNSGYECGLNIESFNDIKIGDIIEGFEEVEVKK
jgi:translation initiation factor IF-2